MQSVIFYFNAYIEDNLGDWYIIKVLLERLSGLGRVICRHTEMGKYNLPGLEYVSNKAAFRRLLVKEALAAILYRDRRVYVVLPPGHSFTGAQSFAKLRLQMGQLVLMGLLRLFDVRICSLGTALGPFDRIDSVLESARARLMHVYSARDSVSRNYAERVTGKPVEAFCDFSLLDDLPWPDANASRANGIVFSFREKMWNSPGSPVCNAADLLGFVEETVGILTAEGYSRFLAAYQVAEDKPLCEALVAHFGSQTMELVEGKLDWPGMMDLYSGCEMVFSNRLHVLLFALKMGALPVAVVDSEKHHKIIGIFKDAGLQDLIINLSESVNRREQLQRLRAHRTAYLEQARTCVQQQREEALAMLTRIFKS